MGASIYYDSGKLDALTSTSITNLPSDGESVVHVRLWYRNSGNRWRFIDHTYISGQATTPVINISPATGGLLASPVQNFSWQTDNSEIAEWWLYAGTTPGARDISDSGNLKPTQASMSKEYIQMLRISSFDYGI